jgi:acetyl-CoA acyltransferase
VSGVRTAFLDSGGAFSPLMTYQLGALAIEGLIKKTGIAGNAVQMLTMGTVLHEVETPNVARDALLEAGLPTTIPAFTTSMAGLSASVGFTSLCDMIALGRIKVGIAAGTESFSDIPVRLSQKIRRAAMKLRQNSSAGNVLKEIASLRPKDLIPVMPSGADFTTGKVMGICAEAMVKKFNVKREDCDKFTVRSHVLAVKAQQEGRFKEDIIPVHIAALNVTVSADDTPRADCNLSRLGKMKPIFDKKTGTITAAGSSRFTDGAAALLVTSAQAAQDMGLQAKAVVLDYELAAVKDLHNEMLLGPAVSIPNLLRRNHLSISDIDVWELHEAFAAQILANVNCMAEPQFADEYHGANTPGLLPLEKLNTWGGSLSLGNPFAATGIRLLFTAANRMAAEGKRYAVVSSCAGGGLGAAILLENPNLTSRN